MAEILLEFEDTWMGADGKQYEARACGRGRADSLWEGWLEFVPSDGGAVIATGRETTQPNRDDILYWATGLTYTYVEGALLRMLKPLPRLTPRAKLAARPAYDGPAPPPVPASAIGGHAVLNPFEVYRESDTVLRGQLNALDDGQLRNIIREYAISAMDPVQLGALSRAELIAMIIVAAEKHVV
jgi:hypothetical protein